MRRMTAIGFVGIVSLVSVGLGPRPNPSPQKEKRSAASRVFARVGSAVVVVEARDEDLHVVAQGSGVIIDIAGNRKGLLVTNKHLLTVGSSWRARRGKQEWALRLKWIDPDHDLCGFRLNDTRQFSDFVSVLRNSASLEVGQGVYAIGTPEGLESTLSEGLVSGIRDLDGSRFIQTSAPISPGSSGGGLFDQAGRLIGITTIFMVEGQNLNFAVPAEEIARLAPHDSLDFDKLRGNSKEIQAVAWLEFGRNRNEDEHVSEAIAAWEQATHLRPDFAAAWLELGFAHEPHGSGDSEASRAAYKSAVRASPACVNCWIMLGYSLLNDRPTSPQEAVQAFEEAVRLDSSRAAGWDGLGSAYADTQQDGKAVGALEESIQRKPDEYMTWESLGDSHLRLGHTEKANESFREAVRLLTNKPSNEFVWQHLGDLYMKLGRTQEAITAFKQSLRLRSDNAFVLVDLAKAYARVHDRGKFLEIYRRVKSDYPWIADQLADELTDNASP